MPTKALKSRTEDRIHEDGCDTALEAVERLLVEDFEKTISTQKESARTAISKRPSNWELLLAVKQLAGALADVCRSHAGRCALVLGKRGDQDPVSTTATLLRVLADYLGVPDKSIFLDEWHHSKRLREFVQLVSDADIKLMDGEFTDFRLPRWEPISGFARRLAGLKPAHPSGEDPFLSPAETEEHLRELGAAFRKTLFTKLDCSTAEALLVTVSASLGHGDSARSTKDQPLFRSPPRTNVGAYLREHPNASDRDILTHLRENHPKSIPLSWSNNQKLASDTFRKVRRAMGIPPRNKRLSTRH